MSDCIFCKIANGELPSSTVYEDDTFRAVLDISPANKGHVLIIPKAHAKDVRELPTETAGEVLPLAAKIGVAQQKALNTDGFNLVVNTGEAAGQTVMHFHMHVIPRYEGDSEMVTWSQGFYGDGEAQAVAAEIAGNME